MIAEVIERLEGMAAWIEECSSGVYGSAEDDINTLRSAAAEIKRQRGALMELTTAQCRIAQLEADVEFLLLRATEAGSVSFKPDRWTGMSSNALVAVAYGGEQTSMPSDRGDYAACVRTYVRLPHHRRTQKVRDALKAARAAYLARYPEGRFPATRAAALAQRLEEVEAIKKRRRMRRAKR